MAPCWRWSTSTILIMKYFDELKRSMEMLADHPRTLFLGQAVACAGTGMSNTLKDINDEKKLELAGKIPVSIFPRWNFLVLGTNQIVNHLDKFSMISDFKTKAIIRTSIGSIRPLHPQHQHTGDYTEAFNSMCDNIEVIRLDEPEDIYTAYEKALWREDGKSTILVEWGDYYNEK